MNYIKFTFGIFIILAVSRFIPHPPNFTSLIALSFYVPVIMGRKFIPAVILSFFITDFFLGFHSIVFFTWGSVLIIGIISKYFANTILSRVSGALFGTVVFFILTNFGVWVLGSYGYTFDGLMVCYALALPFLAYSFISTFIFSGVIEGILKLKFVKNLKLLQH